MLLPAAVTHDGRRVCQRSLLGLRRRQLPLLRRSLRASSCVVVIQMWRRRRRRRLLNDDAASSGCSIEAGLEMSHLLQRCRQGVILCLQRGT